MLAGERDLGDGLHGRRRHHPVRLVALVSNGENGEQGEQGIRGEHGERGDSGQRGVAGERGPKGDHGQHGETGKTGARGRSASKRGLIGYLILTSLVVFGFYLQREADLELERTTKLICSSSNANRDALRTILIDAQNSENFKNVRPEEKARTMKFYEDSLARIPPDPCDPPKIGDVIP